jgi:predicted nuclease with TOPRIM domain
MKYRILGCKYVLMCAAGRHSAFQVAASYGTVDSAGKHQKLVTDNEQLRAELEEKRAKVDQQQEKMCDLLHLNQK